MSHKLIITVDLSNDELLSSYMHDADGNLLSPDEIAKELRWQFSIGCLDALDVLNDDAVWSVVEAE